MEGSYFLIRFLKEIWSLKKTLWIAFMFQSCFINPASLS